MLSADNLSYRYTPFTPWVFRNVSFSLSPGEIAGMSGPSGMGKTTLAKIVAGYLSPVEGEVLLDGFPLPAKGFSEVQLLFQHPELTVNPRWKAGKIVSEGFTPSRRLLDRFEVDEEWLSRYPCELSGGQLARIAMVRVLSDKTKFLLTDEITSMLDAVTQARIWKVLKNHVEEKGMGLLVISHDRHLLNRLCHRIINVFDSDDKEGVGKTSAACSGFPNRQLKAGCF